MIVKRNTHTNTVKTKGWLTTERTEITENTEKIPPTAERNRQAPKLIRKYQKNLKALKRNRNYSKIFIITE